MKKQLVVLSLTALMGASLPAQDPQTPPERAPKTPQPRRARAIIERPVPAGLLGPDADEQLSPRLNAIVVVDSQAEVNVEKPPEVTGIELSDVPLLNTPEFRSRLGAFLGRPVTRRLIYQIEQEIILYSREIGRPIIDVILPDQDIGTGVLQLWFLEGKVGEVYVDNPNGKFFRDEFIRSQVRLQPGGVIDSDRLLTDLDWLNRNPFRDVSASFAPATNQFGATDVRLRVEDRRPFRIYGGYENTGTELAGVDRFVAGFNWGNAFGLDHQLNYQYTTDVEFDQLSAHSASYLVPLPWRHTVTLLGSYVDARGNLESFAGSELVGRSYQVSLRYGVPLPKIGRFQHEATAGFDFKRGDNFIEFGAVTADESDTDVAQFQAAYTALLPDIWGQTSFGIEGFLSPGDLTDHNSDEDFDELRPGAKASYLYGRVTAERVTRLPLDFSWIVRGQGQLASERLLPSEQFGVGGFATVRGYEERIFNGDGGFFVSTEVRTPPFVLGNILNRPNGRDQLQFLGFFDYGAISINSPRDTADDPSAALASVGAGLRFTMSRNFFLRFDYGWQLSERDLSDKSSRAHISALASW